MQMYHVVLNGQASVFQSRWILADSPDEAEGKAIATAGDNVWEYDGVDDESIEVVTVDRQPS